MVGKYIEHSSEKIYLDSGNKDVLELVTGTNHKILDVGCGAGSNSRILREMGNIVDGITISSKEGELAKPFLRTLYYHDLEKGLPAEIPGNEYDYVICSHIIEHITFPEKLMTDIRKVLKCDGYLIIALPNLMHYKSRFELLKGNFNYEAAGVFDYTHTKWYTFKTANEMLDNFGFVSEVAVVTGKIPLYSILGRILPEWFQAFVFKSLTWISKGLFGYQLLFKAKRKKQNISEVIG